MQRIEHGRRLLAIYGSTEDMEPGKFFSEDTDCPIQWGAFRLEKGVELKPHIHKLRDRAFTTKTIEFLVVLRGILQVDIFDWEKALVSRFALRPGGWVCLYDGGHGFQMLEDDTRFMEIKLGPFTAVEDDKEYFE